ncbi:cysteine-rich rlk (receptor-like protein kinase) 8 [Plasmopara halstedii]|uniref:Cysteine-rich rlk (Receptor-like protein kinase) 8 n=1 Tax=Plasmopara halstedii TaxID=4781 RepID=A0A0P1B6L3_PLAHL|nr:cysteine-rich rlk (receptor-like protein kinase) 8 [Plasmopara halstedii]CEG49936.1 cysteine-rich rlk (receptor-like protein kinase) 8 [Plasmopara halstedii]|eukprot:XP_024586305.1 cysteine-rich rlk (receptor-like protein kinase) 8 [Plasmopara halstedii]
MTAAHVLNRISDTARRNKTPVEFFSGTQPSLEHVLVFKSTGYVHLDKSKKMKWDARSPRCIFLEYADGSKAYRSWDFDNKRPVKTRTLNEWTPARYHDVVLVYSGDKQTWFALEDDDDGFSAPTCASTPTATYMEIKKMGDDLICMEVDSSVVPAAKVPLEGGYSSGSRAVAGTTHLGETSLEIYPERELRCSRPNNTRAISSRQVPLLPAPTRDIEAPVQSRRSRLLINGDEADDTPLLANEPHVSSQDYDPLYQENARAIQKTEANAVRNPMVPGQDLTPDRSHEAYKNDRGYRELIGSLLYVTNATRPDSSAILSTLSQYLDLSCDVHWRAAVRILNYLKGTSTHAVRFCAGTSNQLSIEAMQTQIGERQVHEALNVWSNIATIRWAGIKSKWQTTVVLPSAEAEYMALALDTLEDIWLRYLLVEMGFEAEGSITIRLDNKSAISMATNLGHTPRTKHIDLRAQFVRDDVELGGIQLAPVPTEDQLADFLTKAIPTPVAVRSE